MPIYAFKCRECEFEREKIQAYDAPAPLCPRCSLQMRRQLSGRVLLDLRGSGWYSDGLSGYNVKK